MYELSENAVSSLTGARTNPDCPAFLTAYTIIPRYAMHCIAKMTNPRLHNDTNRQPCLDDFLPTLSLYRASVFTYPCRQCSILIAAMTSILTFCTANISASVREGSTEGTTKLTSSGIQPLKRREPGGRIRLSIPVPDTHSRSARRGQLGKRRPD